MTRREVEQKIALFCRLNPNSKQGFHIIFGVDDHLKYRFVMEQKGMNIDFALSMPGSLIDEEVDKEYLRYMVLAMANIGMDMIQDRKAAINEGHVDKNWRKFYNRAIASHMYLCKKMGDMAVEAGVKTNFAI